MAVLAGAVMVMVVFVVMFASAAVQIESTMELGGVGMAPRTSGRQKSCSRLSSAWEETVLVGGISSERSRKASDLREV